MNRRRLLILLCALLLGPLVFGLHKNGPSVRYSLTGTVVSADERQVVLACNWADWGGTPVGSSLCFFWADAGESPPALRPGDRAFVRHSGAVAPGQLPRLEEIGSLRRLAPVYPPALDPRLGRLFSFEAAVIQAEEGRVLVRCLSDDSGRLAADSIVALLREDMLLYNPPALTPGQRIRVHWGGTLVQTSPPCAAPIGGIDVLGQAR